MAEISFSSEDYASCNYIMENWQKYWVLYLILFSQEYWLSLVIITENSFHWRWRSIPNPISEILLRNKYRYRCIPLSYRHFRIILQPEFLLPLILIKNLLLKNNFCINYRILCAHFIELCEICHMLFPLRFSVEFPW